MNSNQHNQEIEVIAKLMEFVQSIEPQGSQQPTLNFIFNSYGIGPDGEKESQWLAILIGSTHSIRDYGYTLEQAAEGLLDRLLYPEKYPEND